MPESVSLNEIGLTGLERDSGLVHEEFLPDLKGEKAIKIYTRMAKNDPVVGAMLFAIDMIIRQVDWFFSPATDAPEENEIAEFLESCLHDMSHPFRDTLSEILSMLPYGWSYHEIVYKIRGGHDGPPTHKSKHTDGRVGWRKWAIRGQESLDHWEFDTDGSLRGMWQRPAPDYKLRFIPIEKSLLFRTKMNKGSPEGESILRKAYKPWYLKRQAEIAEAVGVERDLAGLPEIRVPPGWLSGTASPSEKAALTQAKKIVTQVRRDEQEGIISPSIYDNNGNLLYEFKLVTTGGRRQFETNEIIERHSRHIAMAALADFIMLGHEKVGSYALSSDKTEMFTVAVSAWLDAIAGVVNRIAIPRLLELNNMQVEDIPKLEHGELEQADLSALGDYVQKLAGAGFPLFPDAELERHLRAVASLPLPDEETA